MIDHLERVSAMDRQLRAFTCVGTSPGASDGRPDSVALGVKDLFDVAGLPTALGTAALPARQAVRTAAAVAALQEWRAVVVGKTVTSEFAYFGASATRNPWHHGSSPGGSSTGSAAAVGAGQVPLAIGTQTNGSVIRPAAYCGVVGFKPTYGTIPTEGLWLFAPSFDTVGAFARTVSLAGTAADVMAAGGLGFAGSSVPLEPAGLRIAVVRTQDWSMTSAEMRSALEGTARLLADAGADVDELTTPLCGEEGLSLHRTISEFEGAAGIGRLGIERTDLLGAKIREVLDHAATITTEAYGRALDRRAQLVAELDRTLSGVDCVLTVPAAGAAPPAGDNGDPRFCTRWSLAGTPAICLPAVLGEHGLPLGVQLVGRRGTDARLLRLAQSVEELLGFASNYERIGVADSTEDHGRHPVHADTGGVRVELRRNSTDPANPAGIGAAAVDR
ncbi:amidase [Pseudonocardia sp.]|jgi:Asp-tRNA(Asn)/Glu-tRNA(Gln) amidotransferase A subunit family amidase|uniref:amidase n=1 Tax=Pseudonocardia sp. TaxID=60912 RepID=UPI0031FD34DB